MSSKKRGCDYERKLVSILESLGYSVVRVAGSGCSRSPSPDLIASNGLRVIAFEVKSTQKKKVYLNKSVLNNLLSFSKSFNCEAWFAVHLLRRGWFFKKAGELVEDKVIALSESNCVNSF